jgi:hypothetical protein
MYGIGLSKYKKTMYNQQFDKFELLEEHSAHHLKIARQMWCAWHLPLIKYSCFQFIHPHTYTN